MAESIILDPAEVSVARTELNINRAPIQVSDTGIDWGDAEIAAFMAESGRGEIAIDYRVPNRRIEIPLRLTTSSGTTFDGARILLQKKIARIQQEGGWLKRVTSGGTVFADLVNATLRLPGSWAAAAGRYEADASISLEAIPDFYGPEITLTDHVETTEPELVFTETLVDGNAPARVRLVVDDDQNRDKLGVIWAFRTTQYSTAATAKTAYHADELQALGRSYVYPPPGASGNVIRQGTIGTDWTPILALNKGGTAYLTHSGTNRLFARVHTGAATEIQVRAVWDVGDLTNPTENSPYTFPAGRAIAGSIYYIADLGELRLNKVPVGGVHRWTGQIQAKGELGASYEELYVDKVWVVSTDDAMGIATAPFGKAGGFTNYAARDEFAHAAGTLGLKVAPIGGTWSGAGATTDFATGGTASTSPFYQIVTRTTSSDASFRRETLSGSTGTTQTSSADMLFTAPKNTAVGVFSLFLCLGVICRYVDSSNYTHMILVPGVGKVLVQKTIAGVATTLGELGPSGYSSLPNFWYHFAFTVGAGTWSAAVSTPGGIASEANTMSGYDDVFTSGGALASGKSGLADVNASATGSIRAYANFSTVANVSDAVIFGNRSAQFTSQGAYRLDSGGTAYGPVTRTIGELPRLPPSGQEVRTTEVFVKTSRGDLDQLPDVGIDDVSARLFYRPSYLFVAD